MLIQERKYRTCESCEARHLVSNEVYGCDTCRKKIDMNKPKADYLRANVFQNGGGGSEEIIACSWVCMAKALRKVKCDHFVSMPFLHYDGDAKGMQAKDFFALLRPTERTASKEER